jgi:nitroreductase
MNIDQYEKMALKRRAVRNFRPDPVPKELLDRLIGIARWAPSGYNLQPTHFVIVTDKEIKRRLQPACLGQRQIAEAPVIVVLTGDRLAAGRNFSRMVAQEKAAHNMTEEYEKVLGRFVRLAFDQGPLGLGWLGRFILAPVMRWRKPTPSIPAVHKRYWTVKQVMLAAMNFMMAAESAGLSTGPMEGFDESRVRQVLEIPRSHIVPIVIALGYSDDSHLKKTRFPISEILHENRFSS